MKQWPSQEGGGEGNAGFGNIGWKQILLVKNTNKGEAKKRNHLAMASFPISI